MKQIRGILYSDGTPVIIAIDNKGYIQSIIPDKDSDGKSGYYVGPGLIDIQINGYMGVDFTDTTLTQEDMIEVTQALWATGVTSYLPTVITNSDEVLQGSFKRLGKFSRNPLIAKSIPGFHLEGPYISPEKGFRGAHLEKYIRRANWDEFMNYVELSGDMISLVTVAPEFEGGIPFIEKSKTHGIAVSLAHHNADAETIQKAVNAGATLSTHLGNGCANTIHRHNNPFWPQLSNDSLSISIIADGFHLNREQVRTFYKVKGDNKTILVSDALDLAGLPPGEYVRGERKILLTPNVVKFPEENVLAGAASPIKKCVVNMMDFTGCSLESAIRMASANPARLLNLDVGEIMKDKRADLILFEIEDNDMLIHETYVSGESVYKRLGNN